MQRVNIQYSLQVDEIPDEILRLLETIDKDLLSLKLKRRSVDLSMVDELTAVRHKLSSIDVRISDIQNLITGYTNLIMQKNEETKTDE